MGDIKDISVADFSSIVTCKFQDKKYVLGSVHTGTKKLDEIGLVAINDLKKKIIMAEIKLNKKRISIKGLKGKSKHLRESYSGYKPKWLALGIEAIDHYLS